MLPRPKRGIHQVTNQRGARQPQRVNEAAPRPGSYQSERCAPTATASSMLWKAPLKLPIREVRANRNGHRSLMRPDAKLPIREVRANRNCTGIRFGSTQGASYQSERCAPTATGRFRLCAQARLSYQSERCAPTATGTEPHRSVDAKLPIREVRANRNACLQRHRSGKLPIREVRANRNSRPVVLMPRVDHGSYQSERCAPTATQA